MQSASWQGHEDVVRILLEAGGSADHTCNQGATALCIAAQEGHEEVVRTLLAYRANPNHADQFGRTPYRVALKSGHQKVCKILEDFGAVVPTGVKSRSNSSSASSGVGGMGVNGASAETKIGNTPSSPTNNASPSNHCGKETDSPSKKDGKGRDRIRSSGDCITEARGAKSGVKEVRRASDTAAPSTSSIAAATATSTIMALTGSPEMPCEKRKSYHSYNSKSSSTKSSSNMTSSTNQSGGGGGGGAGNMSRLDRECLTFTQQLQQCSMGKNRSRPISRVLSPVSEPQSPVAVRSPTSCQPPPLPSHPPPPVLTNSPAARLGPGADNTGGYCEIHTGLGVQIISNPRKTTTAPPVSTENDLSPPPPPLPPKGPGLSLNRTHAVLGSSNSSPASVVSGSSSMQVKPERRISATINIITNPHADMMSSVEEPVWQRNPAHPASTAATNPTTGTNMQPSTGSYVKNYHNHFIHNHQQQQQPQHQPQQQQQRHNGTSSGPSNHNNFLTACSSSSSSSGSHLDLGSHHHHHHHHHHQHHHHQQQQQQQQAQPSTGTSPSRIIMGQASLANKSPERRWKRNGIVTNPKAMHTSSTTTASNNSNGNNYARSMSNSSNSSNSNSIPQQFHRFSGGAAPNTSTTLISPTSPTSNGHARRASFSPTTSPTNGFESPRRASDANPPRVASAEGKCVDNVPGICGRGSPVVSQPALYQLDYGQQAGVVKPVRPNGLPIKKVNSPR